MTVWVWWLPVADRFLQTQRAALLQGLHQRPPRPRHACWGGGQVREGAGV